MDGGTLYVVFWILKIAAWVFIIRFSLRLNLFRKYPFVSIYIFSSIIFGIVMPFLAEALGTGSLAYSYLYVARSLVTAGLAVAVLLKIHFTIRPWSASRDWHLIAVPSAVVAIGFSNLAGVWALVRLVDVGYAVLSYVGVAALTRTHRARHIDLGWNLKMVLLALTMPAVFYSMTFVVYTAGLNLSREQAGFWMGGLAVSSWIILAIGLSEDSPPRLVGKPEFGHSAPGAGNDDVSERSAVSECFL